MLRYLAKLSVNMAVTLFVVSVLEGDEERSK